MASIYQIGLITSKNKPLFIDVLYLEQSKFFNDFIFLLTDIIKHDYDVLDCIKPSNKFNAPSVVFGKGSSLN